MAGARLPDIKWKSNPVQFPYWHWWLKRCILCHRLRMEIDFMKLQMSFPSVFSKDKHTHCQKLNQMSFRNLLCLGEGWSECPAGRERWPFLRGLWDKVNSAPSWDLPLSPPHFWVSRPFELPNLEVTTEQTLSAVGILLWTTQKAVALVA